MGETKMGTRPTGNNTGHQHQAWCLTLGILLGWSGATWDLEPGSEVACLESRSAAARLALGWSGSLFCFLTGPSFLSI